MVRANIRGKTILFLCDDNACLSLMAEAIGKRLLPPKTQIFSAGLVPQRIDSRMVEAMRQRGIDIVTGSKGLDVIPVESIDLVVTLGTLSHPVFPSRTRSNHWPVSDPRTEPGDTLDSFGRTIDEINNRVAGLFLDYWRNIV
jgi:protein-tyrosine-phosphatase